MALEDLTATAQHFRNAGFTNLDIGALFIAQALDRIADALEAGGGMQGPADQPQLPPWITDHLPTESVASNGWVQVHAGGIFASFANGDRGRIKPWNAVATGEAWAPLYLTEAFIYHAPDAMPWQGFLPAPSAPAGDDVEAGLQAMAPEPSATPAAPEADPGSDWITDRAPDKGDADEQGCVRVRSRDFRVDLLLQWVYVHPGTPWRPI
jgi:hypothetical protein